MEVAQGLRDIESDVEGSLDTELEDAEDGGFDEDSLLEGSRSMVDSDSDQWREVMPCGDSISLFRPSRHDMAACHVFHPAKEN